jgi:hypothetical protein
LFYIKRLQFDQSGENEVDSVTGEIELEKLLKDMIFTAVKLSKDSDFIALLCKHLWESDRKDLIFELIGKDVEKFLREKGPFYQYRYLCAHQRYEDASKVMEDEAFKNDRLELSIRIEYIGNAIASLR